MNRIYISYEKMIRFVSGVPVFFFLLFFFPVHSFAQSPEKMSYQAVLRNSSNELITHQQVGMQISILQGSAGGSEVYVETQTPVTNANGLIIIEIGAGTVVSGDFSAITWSAGPYFIKTETDPAGGTSYTLTGVSQLLSVPYALFAKTTENISETDPVFAAAAAGGITEKDIAGWNNKQDLLTAGTGITIDNNIISTAGTDGDWTVNGNDMYSSVSGNTGIGTNMPGAKLDVAGPIWQTNTGYSVFIGEEAGAHDDLDYHSNVFVGYHAGRANTTGWLNTAIGGKALYSNIEGYRNTATGYKALYYNSTGHDNTATGYSALYANSIGVNNTATGYYALYFNTEGNNNTANGNFSLMHNTSGNNNTASGCRALYSNTTGDNNTAKGYGALYDNTTGNNNTATGYQALKQNTSGNSGNTASGYQSLYYNNGSSNTATGAQALYSNRGSYNTASGYQAINSNQGDHNTGFGYVVLHENTTGACNTAVGSQALYYNTVGKNNTAIGYYAMYNNNSSGDYNTAVGYMAMVQNTTGINNVAAGSFALQSNTTGFGDVAIGMDALYKNTTGYRNTAIGMWALTNNNTGTNNTAVGYYAFYTGADYENSTAIGNRTVITASNQVRLGNSDVTSIGGFTGWSNVSDGRFKTGVKKSVPGLQFILKLQPVTYYLDVAALNTFLGIPDSMRVKSSEQKRAAEVQTGFIAQDVEQAAKEIGFEFHGIDKPDGEKDYYSLRYAEFVVPLVKAVQEQQEIIEAQQKEIDELKILVNQLLQR